jgi:phosphoglucosamine mutase
MLRFGTDGIRGDADADLTPELVVALGRAAARVFGVEQPFVVARDTRRSGPRLLDNLAIGLRAEAATVRDAGVLPTPGLAYLASATGSPALMISASHNPWTDNGIKLFAPGGQKLDDATERRVEDEVRACVLEPIAAHEAAGTLAGQSNAAYVDHLVSALDGRRLDGMSVVLDCANGAASEVGPAVFRALGAEVVVLHAEPNGVNINAGCGSTHPADLQAKVVDARARAGLAFDGDADRVLAVDENGALVDGDQIMVIAALDLHERGLLRNHAIAVTVMSNLGLHQALAPAGIEVVETPVGDRSVFAAIEQHGLGLGGEQSGHVIFRDLATTGDGILTGLLLLDRVNRAARPLSKLAAAMARVPQLLESVRVAARPDLDSASELTAEINAVEAELGEQGRVLVRASGTEPLIRIMVEAPTVEAATSVLARLRRATEEAFGTAAAGR